jgi:CheY-like chemotaxis protein
LGAIVIDHLPLAAAATTIPRPKTVLVVEDEILVRMAVSESLRDAGYRVLEAATGEEAVSLLASFPDIAVLFTDIQMPGALNGAALTRLARRHITRSASPPSRRTSATSGRRATRPAASIT